MATYSKSRKANKGDFINFRVIYIDYFFKILKRGFINYKKILLFGLKTSKKPEIDYPNNPIFTYRVTGKRKINKPYLAESFNSKKAKIIGKSKRLTNIADT